MSTLKEMAAEYRESAAKVRLYMARLRAYPDADPREMELCKQILRELRDTSRLLSGYYDITRTSQNAAIGWKARRSRDDH